MPGTPATTARHAAPRYANTDAADFAAQVNAVTDRFEITAPVFISGLAASRPAAGIADRYHYATDTGELTRDTGSAWVGPLNPRSIATVTTLPASPFDGQIADYLVDATNSIVWRVRWRASNSRWEFLGGPPLDSFSSSSGITITAAAGSPQTTGISIVAPRAGRYWARWGCDVTPGAANTVVQAWLYQAGAQVIPAQFTSDASGASPAPISLHKEWPVNPAALATIDVRMMRGGAGGAATFGFPSLQILPVYLT